MLTRQVKVASRVVCALGWFLAAALGLMSDGSLAEEPPIKIGMSMAQTGGLAAGGKASLLGIEIWRDSVNARGGLLSRKVQLVVYDDKSSAAETPAIYAKLLDVDKVDLVFAPYGTVPTAPVLPLVKQRGLLLMGNFSFQVNRKVHHDMWFDNAPWGPADSWGLLHGLHPYGFNRIQAWFAGLIAANGRLPSDHRAGQPSDC